MTPQISARAKWVETLSRRLFTGMNIVGIPAAWTELMQDPVQRLELQLRLVTREPDTGEPQVSEPPRGSETGVVMKPVQAAARSFRAAEPPGSVVAGRIGFPERSFSRTDPLPPRQAAVSLDEGDNRAAAIIEGDNRPAKIIVPLVQGDGRLPRRQAADATTPGTEVSFETVVERTRLVRGAGSLAGLLRANSQQELAGAGEVSRSFGINFALRDSPTPLPRTTEGSQETSETVAVIRSGDGGHRPPLQLKRADSEEPSRPPAANAAPPTIDDVLSELYERIRLEYLRTYGASGD